MAFVINGTEQLSNGDNYKFIEKHRGSGNPKASIWACTFKEEFDLIEDGLTNNYIETRTITQAYNLQHGLLPIGRNNIHPELKLAKFVNSTPELWHGYPADHVKNNQDRPTLDVLSKMNSNGLITLKQKRKISQGKKI